MATRAIKTRKTLTEDKKMPEIETNQGIQENPDQQQEPKVYTQDEVNKVVQERLARERAKFEGYEELKQKAAKFDEIEENNKSELQKAQEKAAELEAKLTAFEQEKTTREMREKVAQEKGIPADLLTGNSEEDCNAQADKILEFAKTNGYPMIKDAGEPKNNPKTTTKQKFKEWADKNMP
jgi:hypothetical protein